MALNSLGLGITISATDQASGPLNRAQKSMRGVQGAAEGLAGKRGVQAATASMNQMAEAAANSRIALGAFSAFQKAGALATEYEFQLARVRTIIDESSMSTQQLADLTSSLSSQYGTSAVKQMESMYEVGSAGITDAVTATEVLTAANKFAVGGTVELADGLNLLTSVINSYGSAGLTSARATDILFKTINLGKTNATELSASMGEVLATARASGVTFEELGAVLGTVTTTIKTPQAVTGLNAMLANILKPSKEAADEAKRLNIAFDATALKEKHLSGVLAQLDGHAGLADDSFQKLFGSIDGSKVALTLAAEGGSKFRAALDQMANSAGETDKAVGIMSVTTRQAEKRFAALKDDALTLVGEQFESLKAKAYEMGNALLGAFNTMDPAMRKTLVTVLALGTGALGLASGITAASRGLSVLTGGAGLKGLLAVGGPVLAVVAGLALAFVAFKAAYDQNLGGFGDRVRGAWESVKTYFGAIAQLFGGGELAKGTDRDNPAVRFAEQTYQAFQRLQAFLRGVWGGFTEGLKNNEGSFRRLGEAWDKLTGSIGKGDATTSAGDAMQGAADKGRGWGDTLAKVAGYAADLLTMALKLADAIKERWPKIEASITRVSEAFESAKQAFDGLAEAVTGGSEAAADANAPWGILADTFVSIAGSGLRELANNLRDIGNFLRNIGLVGSGMVDIVRGIFGGGWTMIWVGALKVVTGMVMGVVDLLLAIPLAAADMIDKVAGMVGKDSNLGGGLREWRDNTKQGIMDSFGPAIDQDRLAAQQRAIQFAYGSPRQDRARDLGQAGGAFAPIPMEHTPAAVQQAGQAQLLRAAMQMAGQAAPGAVAFAPVALSAQMVVDGEVLGRIALKGQASSKSRGSEPVPVGVD